MECLINCSGTQNHYYAGTQLFLYKNDNVTIYHKNDKIIYWLGIIFVEDSNYIEEEKAADFIYNYYIENGIDKLVREIDGDYIFFLIDHKNYCSNSFLYIIRSISTPIPLIKTQYYSPTGTYYRITTTTLASATAAKQISEDIVRGTITIFNLGQKVNSLWTYEGTKPFYLPPIPFLIFDKKEFEIKKKFYFEQSLQKRIKFLHDKLQKNFQYNLDISSSLSNIKHQLSTMSITGSSITGSSITGSSMENIFTLEGVKIVGDDNENTIYFPIDLDRDFRQFISSVRMVPHSAPL